MSPAGSRAALPRGAQPPYRVYVNGVPQREGEDYRVSGGELVFTRPLEPERVSVWRWALMFLSIAGKYGGETVDLHYTAAGRERVATGLEILPPKAPPTL